MERRPLKGFNRPLSILGLKAIGAWLLVIITSAILARWIGAWAMLLPVAGLLFIFVMEARLGSRHAIWTLLTTQCPECGMWPLKYQGASRGTNNQGALICEKCHIEWDLGRNMAASQNFDPAPISKNISEIIEKHLQTNDPPETRQTLERLTREGRTADEARQLISTVVMVEIFHTFFDRKPFDPKRFAWNLAQLPQKPWDAQGREIYKAAG